MSAEQSIKELAILSFETSKQLDKQADLILRLMERVAKLEDDIREIKIMAAMPPLDLMRF